MADCRTAQTSHRSVVKMYRACENTVRADVAESTQGFDESFHMYCEEIDWSWRVRESGWEIYTVPSAEVVHYSGESTRQIPAQSMVNLWESRARLYSKHHGRLKRAVAGWMVRSQMSRRARRAGDQQMKAAYEHIVAVWSQNGRG